MRIPLNEGSVLRELCLILAYVPAGLCFIMADTQSVTPICRAVVRLVRDDKTQIQSSTIAVPLYFAKEGTHTTSEIADMHFVRANELQKS